MNFTGFRAEELGSFTPDTLRKAGCAFALEENALLFMFIKIVNQFLLKL